MANTRGMYADRIELGMGRRALSFASQAAHSVSRSNHSKVKKPEDIQKDDSTIFTVTV